MSQALPPADPTTLNVTPSPADDLERETLIGTLGEYSLHLMWILRQEAMRAFEPLGLRPVKALLLELIGRGMVHPKDIAEVLDTLPPAVSAMLAELEDKGLVQRDVDPSDRRRIQLTLTPAGEALRLQLKAAWHNAGVERLRKLGREDLETLLRVYRTLLEEA